MPEVTFDDVRTVSDEFFRRHWSISEAVPVWNKSWGLFGTLPGHDMQGVYLLLGAHDEVLYIGVGASIGTIEYVGHGLGYRTSHYTRMAENQSGVSVAERKYVPKDKWADLGLSKIVTLGFNQNYAYLAYGLEAFLLREIVTPENKIRSARASSF